MYLLKPGKSQPFISHNVKADTIIPNTFDISLFSSEIFPGFIIGFRKEYNTVRNKPEPQAISTLFTMLYTNNKPFYTFFNCNRIRKKLFLSTCFLDEYKKNSLNLNNSTPFCNSCNEMSLRL